jgi:hypothetical protein
MLLVTVDRKRAELYRLSDNRDERKNLAVQELDVAARLTAAALGWKTSLPASLPAGCASKLREGS